MDENFLLGTETAKTLFHIAAKEMPIVDFHNHLSPREIYENKCYDNIADVWLGGDHYKWRAMRSNGISERYVTGDATPYEKFEAWADTVQRAIGNPLYHWTHLELQRYFGIDTPLNPKTAREIWDKCNAKLRTKDYSVRNLLAMQNVKILCTTDDPADSLEWHTKLRNEPDLCFQVLPSFRPEKALGIEKDGFATYLKTLGEAAEVPVTDSAESVLNALINRLDFFVKTGCRVTDHSLESAFYIASGEQKSNKENADKVLRKRLNGEIITEDEAGCYRGYLLSELGKAYAKRNLVMQLHIGAIRNNATRFLGTQGADHGFDSVNDFNYAPQLAALLDSMDRTNELPRTILYCLNSKDLDMLATMAGNFQSNEDGIRGKVQLGSAWWFLDHKTGMEHQLQSLSDVGLLSTFIGMLTDSRSFLSFPRHEYFRRILCNKVGAWVENGEYPNDEAYLSEVIRDICAENAMRYFQFERKFERE